MSDIEHLTYNHAHFGPNMFYLDQLLNRMPNPASLESPTSRKRELGILSRLPIELLLTALEDLSIPDLMRFRHCNRSAASLVDSNPLLRAIIRFAPNVLKGIIALRVTASITARQLRRKCKQKYCDDCGELAPYLYLPTCLRACLNCIRPVGGRRIEPPLSKWEMLHFYEIEPQESEFIPSFQFLPATFTNGVHRFRISTPQMFYDQETVRRKRLETHGSMKVHLTPEELAIYEGRMCRDIDLERKDLSRPLITTISEPAPEEIRMHMCVVFAPWIDSSSSQTEQGFYCTSCLYSSEQNLLFTRETFLEHLEYCRVRPFDGFMKVLRNRGLALFQDFEQISAK